MDADWSVELGEDDPALEFPWASPDGSRRYVDLQRSRESIGEISEATQYRELAECLLALNVRDSPWQTVKCDVWYERQLDEAEKVYDAALKLCSYVDLIAQDVPMRFLFDRHEQFVKMAGKQLSDNDDQPISCELTVRRCWYREERPGGDHTPGFSVTVYVIGYVNYEAEARARWVKGLQRVTSLLAGVAP
jgi:hypothetical protein